MVTRLLFLRPWLALLLSSFASSVLCICYYPDGTATNGDVPCLEGSEASWCCGFGYACLSNKTCMATPETPNATQYVRGSCTDETWRDGSCLNFCVNGAKPAQDDLSGGEGMAKCPNTDMQMYYCIDFDQNAVDCASTSNIAVQATGTPSVLTTIGYGTATTSSTGTTSLPSSTTSTSSFAKTSSAQNLNSSTTSLTTKVSSASSFSSAATTTTPSSTSISASSSLSKSAITIGVSVGVSVAVLALSLVAIFFFFRRYQKRRRLQLANERPSSTSVQPPFYDAGSNVDHLNYNKPELPAEAAAQEMASYREPQELSAQTPTVGFRGWKSSSHQAQSAP